MEAAPSSATGLQLRKNVRTAASGPLSPEHVDPGDECQLPNVRTTSISSQSKLSRNVRSQVNRSRSSSPPAQDGCALTLERELDEVVRSRSRSHRATRVPSRSDLNVQGHDLRFCAGLTLLLPTNHTSSRTPKADRVLGHQPRPWVHRLGSRQTSCMQHSLPSTGKRRERASKEFQGYVRLAPPTTWGVFPPL